MAILFTEYFFFFFFAALAPLFFTLLWWLVEQRVGSKSDRAEKLKCEPPVCGDGRGGTDLGETKMQLVSDEVMIWGHCMLQVSWASFFGFWVIAIIESWSHTPSNFPHGSSFCIFHFGYVWIVRWITVMMLVDIKVFLFFFYMRKLQFP